jgi:hypothetical protein
MFTATTAALANPMNVRAKSNPDCALDALLHNYYTAAPRYFAP